jgi:hypothetical protein
MRGATVTVKQFGASRTMLAASAMRGYPRVRVSLTPEDSVGPVQFFEVIAETSEPLNNGSNLAEHAQSTEVRVSQGGRETRTIRGTVLLTPAAAGTARAWVEANVLPGAVTDAGTLNLGVERRFTIGDDAKRCDYEITLAPITPQSGGGGTIIIAEVNDATEINDEQRTQRTVSGYAVGDGAAAYAESQRPAGAGEVVTRENISAPRWPDGRISFNFVALKGVINEDFPGAPVLSVRESIEDASPGQPVRAATFVNGAPILYYAETQPFRYRQSTSIESLGELAGPPSLLLSADNLAAEPSLRIERSGVIVRTSLTAEFVSPTPLTLPSPRSQS